VIVLDASAVVELLLATEQGRSIADRIDDPTLGLHAPHLVDIEVAQTLRRYVRDGALAPVSASAALDDLHALDLERHAHEPLLDRIWSLRQNLTAYDAVYVALAEALDATLLTCDRKLARAPGIGRRVEIVRYLTRRPPRAPTSRRPVGRRSAGARRCDSERTRVPDATRVLRREPVTSLGIDRRARFSEDRTRFVPKPLPKTSRRR